MEAIEKTCKIKVWKLGWGGMKKVTIIVNEFPKDILKPDSWFAPTIGELCFNLDGQIDVVKDIQFIRPKDPFKGYNLYHLASGKKLSNSLVTRIEVKKNKEFYFKNKTYTHQKSVDGDVINKLALSYEDRKKK
jgi:hypothetical protein